MRSALRVAMWSGPRNISTAMMRAWENRDDTVVVDEPLYAHYLFETGVDHPGREQVLASQSTDWRAVVAALTGLIPEGKPIWYQKHMTQHVLPDMDLDWL
ncbi:MAG TPA: HAD family hydrolase, partial [Gammaproteobacteria bacterium]|nr:HAD family hydrolase [Gammaproteobacteria bacterium]